MFSFLGAFVFRHRWTIVTLWLAGFLASLFLAPQASRVLKAGGFTERRSEAARTLQLLEEELAIGGSSLVVIFSHPTWPADSPQFLAAQEEALAALRSEEAVSQIVSYSDHTSPPAYLGRWPKQPGLH